MRPIMLFVASLIFANPVLAEDYEKGPNGGLMLDVAGIDAELLSSGREVTINVFEANNPIPVPTSGYTAQVLIAGRVRHETVALAPSGTNSLTGEAKDAIASDATVTLTIRTAEGRSGQVKFRK
jgi:hypothetical protein